MSVHVLPLLGLLFQVSTAPPAQPPAPEPISRLGARVILDRRGTPVARLVRGEARRDGLVRVALLAQGLDRDDLLVTLVRPADPPKARSAASPALAGAAVVPESSGVRRYEIRLGSGQPLVVERPEGDARVAVSMGPAGFRYYAEDARTRTVRCALTRLVDQGDGRLLSALAELVRVLPAAPGEELWPLTALPERSARDPSLGAERAAEDDEAVAPLIARLRSWLVDGP